MAEIVNLRAARKRKARKEKDRSAEENRLLHGRSRRERQQVQAETGDRIRRLDRHIREKSEDEKQQ